MPPVVSIVGKSNSGKTTFIEKLIGELKSRGYRVATIKHVSQALTFDESDKDSWRHVQAGSEATAIVSPNKVILIRPVAPEPTLDEVTRAIGEGYDIILTEGFKQGDAPKIEIHRREVGTPLTGVKKLMAVVTDEPLATKARQFSLQDIKGLADLLEEEFIKPQRERISLYVNDIPIALTIFPRQIISNILLAIASCLKGVGDIKNIQIFLRKEPEK